jgi:hypothetical protein
MFRGTLRYAGFCAHMHALVALGFLAVAPTGVPAGVTLRGLLAQAVGGKEAQPDDELFAAVVAKVAATAAADVRDHVARLAALSPKLGAGAAAGAAGATNASLATDVLRQEELRRFVSWLGFFSSAPANLRGADAGDGGVTAVAKPVPAGEPTTHVPLDTLCALLVAKPEMSYAPGERDMALMVHEIEVAYPDGRRELRTSSLVQYGDLAKHQTAMARTVGCTAAIGAQLILDGRIHSRGVLAPMTRDWYGPMLDALEQEGIALRETVRAL